MGKMFDALQKVERERYQESKRVTPNAASEDKERERYQESKRVTYKDAPKDSVLDKQKEQRERYQESERVSYKASTKDVVLDDRLVSFFDPSSMVAEQFKRLRTYVIKPGVENSPKTILVTSAMAGEGKSMIAINLAITIAVDLNSNALIVDCDLRNPSLSRWFGFREQKGLTNYLLGEALLPDLLVKTSVDKLTILPGGTVRENPVELIGSKKMKSLVADLKMRYDDRYIILDSSPLLATTEPRVLSDMADGIIFVIKSADTPRESVQQALKLIDKKRIIGVVLNQVQFKTEALIRRYFGTDRYNDYRYSARHSKPNSGVKFASRTRDKKMVIGGHRTKK
ncbi:MAG: polysaccharide biosynthesis tyrosine autokinase [Deltaproteobacteria bacterium]|nr:MAG: polysaccharide biosynthesis tyrosine autokinase [Deltaproteobacteria bacterium]